MTALLEAKRAPSILDVLAIAIAIFSALVFLPPLPAPLIALGFADERSFLGIPNFMNVVSNIPFLLVGVWGMHFVVRPSKA